MKHDVRGELSTEINKGPTLWAIVRYGCTTYSCVTKGVVIPTVVVSHYCWGWVNTSPVLPRGSITSWPVVPVGENVR